MARFTIVFFSRVDGGDFAPEEVEAAFFEDAPPFVDFKTEDGAIIARYQQHAVHSIRQREPVTATA